MNIADEMKLYSYSSLGVDHRTAFFAVVVLVFVNRETRDSTFSTDNLVLCSLYGLSSSLSEIKREVNTRISHNHEV